MPDELIPALTLRLIQALDCTVTLRRGTEDGSTEVGIVVTTAWAPGLHRRDASSRAGPARAR